MEQLAEVGAQDGQDGVCCALTDQDAGGQAVF